jgi:hypothetical protein
LWEEMGKLEKKKLGRNEKKQAFDFQQQKVHTTYIKN